MSMGRIVSSALAVATVGVGAVVVVGLAQDSGSTADTARSTPLATHAPLPAIKTFAGTGTPSATSAPTAVPSTTTAASARPVVASPAAAPASIPVVTRTSATTTTPAAVPRPAAVTKAPAVTRTSAVAGRALPLHYSTGSATKVITVTAHSRGSTTATVQAWSKVSGGWRKVGSGIPAYIGSQGMTTSPSETKSATPMGSFTLTQAFGAYADPGTALTYHRTNSRYYWMSTTYGSQARLYNTMQVCPASNSGCYNNGVNERLYYETPSYNYAVVIDYNTRNAPGGVRDGKGSAFFFHVSTGSPTAGCVAIPQSRLVPIMRWLTPSSHPRMLIGTT